MNELFKTLKNLIRTVFAEMGVTEEIVLQTPPNRAMGDLSLTSALKLAKTLKKSPMQIAQEIKDKLDAAGVNAACGFSKIEVAAPGFINFFIAPEKVKAMAAEVIATNGATFGGCIEAQDKKRIMLEFCSANPTGPLSIAHGRQAMVGDILGSILSFAGHDVAREYYVNDEGKQIQLYAESVAERMKEIKGLAFAMPEGGYMGEYVKIAAQAMLDAGVDCADVNDVREKSTAWNIAHIRATLESCGVTYDRWVSQKKIELDGEIHKAIAILKEKGHTFEAEDATWFKSTAFGDDKDRVLVRSNGILTYFAADVAYHLYKLERGYDVLIDLWGPDHHGYIKRVDAAIEAFKGKGNFDFSVIIIQLVTVKDMKMSKRKGTIILLNDLIEEVGKDAARLYYVLRRNSSHLDFDIDLAKAMSSDNPLYYIQYAHARIASIIAKSGKKVDATWLSGLSEEGEFAMIKELFEFSTAVRLSAEQREPYIVIEYLKNLAGAFHKFYEHNRILVEGDEAKTQARLALIEAVRITFNTGLRLLGVSAPEKM